MGKGEGVETWTVGEIKEGRLPPNPGIKKIEPRVFYYVFS